MASSSKRITCQQQLDPGPIWSPPFRITKDPTFRSQHSTKRWLILTPQLPQAKNLLFISACQSSSWAVAPPWCVVIYDVHQATVVLTLLFPASIDSLTICNSTQDFCGSPLTQGWIKPDRTSQSSTSSLSTYRYLHLLISIHQLHHHHHHHHQVHVQMQQLFNAIIIITFNTVTQELSQEVSIKSSRSISRWGERRRLCDLKFIAKRVSEEVKSNEATIIIILIIWCMPLYVRWIT